MIRLFVSTSLFQGTISLSASQIHYIYTVMRLKPGAWIEVFNGKDGGWKAVCLEKTEQRLYVKECIHDQPEALPCLHLYISLFKRLDWVLEKSTELGVTHIHPVLTQRSSVRHFNVERAYRIVQEASEQSGRYTLPNIMPLISFEDALRKAPKGWVAHMNSWDTKKNSFTQVKFPINLWIGPEGGWSECELEIFQRYKEIYPLPLAQFCLRAETAVVAALITLQNKAQVS
ncbi:RsmE family RNA methyltransferase [Holospora curviuscula]|uniref:Ribosomal RNA small subunit methyltransferase E n=1 Tax=Holospora curviuscula TaxID=1082868 RepID=A0A2S5R891_9PROT|nr:RsmE family RNA methyltransferase [Holospora curviuscula]PPE03507.1 Ribosomal RNA small subunit methyltransferase E [Holospora curviuscula]